MRKAIIFLSLFGLLTGNAMARQKARAEITSVKQKAGEVDITITSATKFRVGNNAYILHVGEKSFMRNRQGKNMLTFFIPKAEYSQLPADANIYLTYGHKYSTEAQLEAAAKQPGGHCEALGRLGNKLTK